MKQKQFFLPLFLFISLFLGISSCKKANLPEVGTTSVLEVYPNSVKCKSSVTGDGGAEISERGICWGSTSNPTIDNSYLKNGSGTGEFSTSIFGLKKDTKYYVRTYAKNSEGVSYGEDNSFTTTLEVVIPTVSTLDTTETTSTTIKATGTINQDGNSAIIAAGICWSTSQVPTVEDYTCVATATSGTYTCTLNNLQSNKLFYYAAYATNKAGTAYGEIKTFKTAGAKPDIMSFSALNNCDETMFSGQVNTKNLTTVITIEYGLDTNALTSITATQTTVSGTSFVDFSKNVTGFLPNLTNKDARFYYRIKAVNSFGTTTTVGEQNSNFKSFKLRMKIGGKYLTGYIYDLSSDSLHGKVASATDIPNATTSSIWGCYGTSITGADGTAMGTGAQNTTDILAGCTTANIAAKRCSSITGGGWYLPSKDELHQIFVKLKPMGVTFSDGYYWTSSEADAGRAYRENYSTFVSDKGDKDQSYKVRASKSF